MKHARVFAGRSVSGNLFLSDIGNHASQVEQEGLSASGGSAAAPDERLQQTCREAAKLRQVLLWLMCELCTRTFSHTFTRQESVILLHTDFKAIQSTGLQCFLTGDRHL